MLLTDDLIQDLTINQARESQEATLIPARTNIPYRIVKGEYWPHRDLNGQEIPGEYFFRTNEDAAIEDGKWCDLVDGCILETISTGKTINVVVIRQRSGWYFLKPR